MPAFPSVRRLIENAKSDEELKRILGMNAPLATLSLAELDALIHRVAGLSAEQKARVESILVCQEGFPKRALDEFIRRTTPCAKPRDRSGR